jgi:YD repeat-containing protein
VPTIAPNVPALLRRTNVSFTVNGASTRYGYGYDAASRLSNVTAGDVSASYGYIPNSPLVSTVTFRHSGATRMTTTKSYDLLNRLTTIEN